MVLHDCRSGVLQGHTFLLLMQATTMGVIGRCLRPCTRPGRYAGGVSTARYDWATFSPGMGLDFD